MEFLCPFLWRVLLNADTYGVLTLSRAFFFILLRSVRLNIHICRDTYNRIRSNANKVEGRGRNKNFYVAVVTNGLAVSISISDLSRCSVYNYS